MFIARNAYISETFIDHQEASQFIKLRSKRANSWHRFEETEEGNLERECLEEACSREEAREALEDDALTVVLILVVSPETIKNF